MGRHDVRVPDAAAAAARLPRHAARRELPCGRAPADRVRQRATGAVGNLRVGLLLHRSRRDVSVQGVRRARPRAEAPTRRRTGRVAVRHRARWHHRSGGGGGEPDTIDARGARRPIRVLRINRLPAAEVCSRRCDDGRRRRGGNRARVLRPPPGNVARRAHQRAARRHLRDAVPRRSAGQGD